MQASIGCTGRGLPCNQILTRSLHLHLLMAMPWLLMMWMWMQTFHQTRMDTPSVRSMGQTLRHKQGLPCAGHLKVAVR